MTNNHLTICFSYFGSTILGSAGVYVPYSCFIDDILGSPPWVSALYAIVMVINFCYTALSGLTFLLIYGEIVAGLAAWVSKLKDDCKNGVLGKDFIQSGMDFIKTLRSASDLFSGHLFVISFVLSIGLVMSTYRTVAFFIGDYEKDWLVMCSISAQTLFVILASFPMIYFAFMEHEIHSRMEELNYVLVNFQNEECRPIMEHLQNFKGFTALDFFYVNKSFLSSIFANFVGYLIILLQFRVGEENRSG